MASVGEQKSNPQGEWVAEFTRIFVRALNRTGYYTPEHPEYRKARLGLFEALTGILQNQTNLTYLVGPRRVQEQLPEIYVDGAGPERMELRHLFTPGTWSVFAPDLVEYLQRRSIVTLALRVGIDADEFGQLLEVLAGPVGSRTSIEEGTALVEAIAARRLAHVSVVIESDALSESVGLPWQVRLALARLTRDLRSIPLLREASPADLARVRAQLVGDVLRPLAHNPLLLRHLLFHANLVQEHLADLPELKTISLDEMIVRGVPGQPLLQAAQQMLRDLDPHDTKVKARATQVLTTVGNRLLGEEATPEGDTLLRDMCKLELVSLAQLPKELREWIFAEQWLADLTKHIDAIPPLAPPPIGLHVKVVRLALSSGRYGVAKEIVEQLRAIDADAVAQCFEPQAVETMIAGMPEDEGRKLVVGLLREGSFVAAEIVANIARTGGSELRQEAARLLGDLEPFSADAARRALDFGVDDEEVARLLIPSLGSPPDRSATPTLARLARHSSPRVRREALAVLAQVDPVVAEVHLVRALDEADPSMLGRALLICATSGIALKRAASCAIHVLSIAREGESSDAVASSIDVLRRTIDTGELPAETLDVLDKFVPARRLFGRLRGREVSSAEVLVAIVGLLAAIKDARAKKLLKRLQKMDDKRVKEAARRARASKS